MFILFSLMPRLLARHSGNYQKVTFSLVWDLIMYHENQNREMDHASDRKLANFCMEPNLSLCNVKLLRIVQREKKKNHERSKPRWHLQGTSSLCTFYNAFPSSSKLSDVSAVTSNVHKELSELFNAGPCFAGSSLSYF